jgi:hypothetical protein
MSFDFATHDEAGQPWNFAKKEMSDKANKPLEETKPALLVARPFCCPFSSWMSVNYQKTMTEEVRRKLRETLEHLRFALDLRARQHKRGGLFVFKHLVAATSWGTRMMATM